ncbi:hypothetical protein B0H13DRAFT_2305435 [Mycena leptocephala]|nr:hypothetical protein B0H13DRAFT_2305435 [Mycena leptocephala]
MPDIDSTGASLDAMASVGQWSRSYTILLRGTRPSSNSVPALYPQIGGVPQCAHTNSPAIQHHSTTQQSRRRNRGAQGESGDA